MPDDQRTIPITKGRPQPVEQAAPPPPLADRRFGDRRRPIPPRPLADVVWPLIAGLCLGIFAPELLKAANALGHWGAMLVFPFAMLAGRPEFGLREPAARTLSSIILYAQFPVEGALAMLHLRRHFGLRATLVRIAWLHLAGAVLLWLLNRPHAW